MDESKRPQTMAQKILADHSGKEFVEEGEIVNAYVDIVLGNDITMPLAIEEFKKVLWLRPFHSEARQNLRRAVRDRENKD